MPTPSHVLTAMGLSPEDVHASLRFGIGRFNTPEEIDYTIEKITRCVRALRDLSPLYELARQGIIEPPAKQ